MTSNSIYTPIGEDGYEFCHPINDKDFDTISTLINGRPSADTWRPVAVKIITDDNGTHLERSDAPWLGSNALIFRSKVCELFPKRLNEFGELLPLMCEGAELKIFNPMIVSEALDESRSSVLRFASGQIMRITRYCFNNHVVRNKYAFKIDNLRVSPTFVNQNFVEAWKKAGLKGLIFEKVWST